MSSYLYDETKPEKVGEGCYERETREGWMGAISLFGGYVNAVVLQALEAEIDDSERLPRSLNLHYLKPFPVGTMRVQVTKEREGSSVSVLSARLFVENQLCGLATGTFGKDRDAVEFTHIKAPNMAMPDFDSEPHIVLDQVKELKCLDHFQFWFEDRDSTLKDSEILVWAKSANEDAPNYLYWTAVSDAIPPVVFTRDNDGIAHFGGSMDYAAHFRSPEVNLEPGTPLIGRIYTAASKLGYVDEDCWLFSPDGELLFQSRQIRFIQKL